MKHTRKKPAKGTPSAGSQVRISVGFDRVTFNRLRSDAKSQKTSVNQVIRNHVRAGQAAI